MDLFEVTRKWQERWEGERAFEPKTDLKRKKFFITTPYPYISGSLHIGHARAVLETDLIARFRRMQGFNVLYPMAFHVSGMPVIGISIAIKNREPKIIELYSEYVSYYVKDKKKVDEIVRSFEDPEKIVGFFIPKMVEEYKKLGLSIDWTRSFTSTDASHRKLVEWQFRKYREKGYLVQGKHPVLFDNVSGNPVGEDDIKGGDIDPVEISEFTLLKFGFGDCFLVAATLRPETVFGQTNLWVNPETEYVKVGVGNEKWVMSRQCLEKLKFQERGPKEIGKVHGRSLIGKKCAAPGMEREIIILPLEQADPEIGTGIVTSVPSDAPVDYLGLKELQDDEKKARQFGLNPAEVKAIKLIPIIESKGFGEFPAVEACERLGVTGLNQGELVEKATHEVYRAGFHTGIMRKTAGRFAGLPVAEAKEKIREWLAKGGKADKMLETSRKAVSRANGKVVVAILPNQWFLNFNAEGWKDNARKCLGGIRIIPESYRKLFEQTFEWLDKRPCTRLRGLGTRFPFDEKWVIESLSDSTIYMSLYTIQNLIGAHGLSEKNLGKEFFDYVYLGEGKVDEASKRTGVKREVLEECRKSFEYWYPNDHRHTFILHLSNHLSFMIFAHAALFPKKFWPREFSFHGLVTSGGKKMSKSLGNVVSINDIFSRFGTDVFRAFLYTSASLDSDFDWNDSGVEKLRRHIEGLAGLLESMDLRKKGKGTAESTAAKWFLSRFNRKIAEGGNMLEGLRTKEFAQAAIYGIYEDYRKARRALGPKELEGINSLIFVPWVKMLSVVMPHIAEELWEQKGFRGFVSLESWPEADVSLIDPGAEKSQELLDEVSEDVSKIRELLKRDKIGKITIFTAPEWKWNGMEIARKACSEKPDAGKIISALMRDDEIRKHGKEAEAFAKQALKAVLESRAAEKVDEFTILGENRNALEKEFDCMVEVLRAEGSAEAKAKSAFPSKPAILIE